MTRTLLNVCPWPLPEVALSYSITSSARPSSVIRKVRSGLLAVLNFMATSTVAGKRAHKRTKRRRSEFAITDTELKLIAAAATIGMSSKPNAGQRVEYRVRCRRRRALVPERRPAWPRTGIDDQARSPQNPGSIAYGIEPRP